MLRANEGFLAGLVRSAKTRVADGYYEVSEPTPGRGLSLSRSLREMGRIPVIAEVKFRSPAHGTLKESGDAASIAMAYEKGGAAAISVLTEPGNFGGELGYLSKVARAVEIPVMMKDIIVDERQVEAARSCGADAVLLIARVFAREFGTGELEEMVGDVHRKGLEAVVEVFDQEEYDSAVSGRADVVGINNRDLDTLGVSLDVSKRILTAGPHPKPVICESGISTREEILALRELGADGFLIGSALMKSEDPVAVLGRMTAV